MNFHFPSYAIGLLAGSVMATLIINALPEIVKMIEGTL